MANAELMKKILKDIQKSGFHAELSARQRLIKSGWKNVKSNGTFYDKDFDKSREIDINVYSSMFNKGKNVGVGVHLIIEVKKTNKPWIIFTSENNKHDLRGAWGILNFKDNIGNDQLSYEKINEKWMRKSITSTGSAFYEAFRDTAAASKTSKIYEAVITACKAAVDTKKRNSWEKKETKPDFSNYHHLDFFMPLVVVDGSLFSAVLDKEGEIKIEEKSFIPVRIDYSSAKYEESYFYPDIITLDFVEEYAVMTNQWLESMYKTVLSNL